MQTLCQTDCCTQCVKQAECGGCIKTNGHPFDGTCIAAECVARGGMAELSCLKQQLIDEINALGLPYLHVDTLYLLSGGYVNLSYPLPNQTAVPFLTKNRVYFGNQIERPDSERCYGVVCDETFLLVSEYGCGGADPQLLLYKKRSII